MLRVSLHRAVVDSFRDPMHQEGIHERSSRFRRYLT